MFFIQFESFYLQIHCKIQHFHLQKLQKLQKLQNPETTTSRPNRFWEVWSQDFANFANENALFYNVSTNETIQKIREPNMVERLFLGAWAFHFII